MPSVLRTSLRRLVTAFGSASSHGANQAVRHYSTKIEIVDAYSTTSTECTRQDFYTHAAQRWVWNESSQLKDRYVQFDIDALVRLAEETAGNNAICSRVSKLPEGNFNKAFMVTMQDGKQLVIKIPNPNSGFNCLTTASEVATMSYVRDRLDLPAPKILAYCAQACNSKLGVEYIVMEKAQGIELSRLWDKMTGRQKVGLVKQLANITAKLSQTHFPACGSLYYHRDISNLDCYNLNTVQIDNDFAIGPITARSWFDDQRSEIDIYRGPWNSSKELVNALIQREMACLNTFTKFPCNRQQGLYGGPRGYSPTRDTKLSVLKDTLKVVPYIMPREDHLNHPILWHNDLHIDNIFVDETNPSQITSIIDWQGVPIYPMFLTAQQPTAIEHNWPKPDDFIKPTLPSNISELEPEEQKKERKRHLEQSLWAIYEGQTQVQAPDLLHAFRHAETLPCQILRLVGVIFDDGEPHVQSLLADVAQAEIWKELVGEDEQGNGNPKIPCPIGYSQEELEKQELEYAKWSKDIEKKSQILNEIGVYTGWDGAIAPNEYDEVVKRLEMAKKRFLVREASTTEEQEQWERVWPFKDEE